MEVCSLKGKAWMVDLVIDHDADCLGMLPKPETRKRNDREDMTEWNELT